MTPKSTRKPRSKPKPYARRDKAQPVQKNPPKTSAKHQQSTRRENLTLSDWLTVFAFVDEHPSVSQGDVVNHFKTLKDGALHFSQSALSRNLKDRKNLEGRTTSYPNALSSKRPRIVTRPYVERALVLWVDHMEKKNEPVNGAMLQQKRSRFEDLFNVPEEERLTGVGWVAKFLKAYKMKEYRGHGEAGSVDPVAVEVERKRMQKISAAYAEEDQWNVDESSLFAFAPPDRGLSTKQFSGKKKEKFRITVAFACNANGSEKLPPFFIGKSKKPRAFGNHTPEQQGFYYRNNKKAWMTAALFEEFIQKLDLKMRAEKRHILLTLDNFSGHFIEYESRNIQLEYFEPNLTSFVQPLDAGIIRCFKAHYRKAMCIRAIELDDAGEPDIYKLNILEGMKMAQEAWDAVSAETIKHCWNHTGIRSGKDKAKSCVAATPALATRSDPGAWNILREFSTSQMTIPEAEKCLETYLGDRYNDEDWRPALNAVMLAEGDVAAAQTSIQKLSAVAGLPKLTIKLPPRPSQSTAVEKELMDTVNKLKQRNRIFGQPPTIEELVDPVEERQDADDEAFAGDGDVEVEIVALVQKEMSEANGEAIEVDDSDDEAEPDLDAGVTRAQAAMLCEQMERLSLKFGNSSTSLDLMKELRKFRAHLRHEDLLKSTQTTLDNFFA